VHGRTIGGALNENAYSLTADGADGTAEIKAFSPVLYFLFLNSILQDFKQPFRFLYLQWLYEHQILRDLISYLLNVNSF